MFSQGSPINIENAVLHWGPEYEKYVKLQYDKHNIIINIVLLND